MPSPNRRANAVNNCSWVSASPVDTFLGFSVRLFLIPLTITHLKFSLLIFTNNETLDLDNFLNKSATLASPTPASSSPNEAPKSFVVAAPNEPLGKITMYSPAFSAACTAGGILSCRLTHMAVTPLDLVKCNMQIDPAKYKSITSGFGVLLKEQGVRGFFKGWVPTLLGYSAQGACKFGFYEFFKKYYSKDC